MGECQRKGRMKVVKEKDPDEGWMDMIGDDERCQRMTAHAS